MQKSCLFHLKFRELKFHFPHAFNNFLIFSHSVGRIFLVEKAETILFDYYGVREKRVKLYVDVTSGR